MGRSSDFWDLQKLLCVIIRVRRTNISYIFFAYAFIDLVHYKGAPPPSYGSEPHMREYGRPSPILSIGPGPELPPSFLVGSLGLSVFAKYIRLRENSFGRSWSLAWWRDPLATCPSFNGLRREQTRRPSPEWGHQGLPRPRPPLLRQRLPAMAPGHLRHRLRAAAPPESKLVAALAASDTP